MTTLHDYNNAYVSNQNENDVYRGHVACISDCVVCALKLDVVTAIHLCKHGFYTLAELATSH